MVEYLGGALLFHMHPQPASPDQFDRFAFPVLLYLSQSFRLRYFVYMSFTELILVSTNGGHFRPRDREQLDVFREEAWD